MILKKPYAFLIKHFKLIHTIILLLMIYLTHRTSLIINFFNSYADTLQLNTKIGLVKSLYNKLMFIFPVLIIIILMILMFVMIIKKKPKIFYICNIVAYILLFVIYSTSRDIISNMEVQIVDIRTILLIRDFMLITIFIQFVSIVLTFVRATGFDIKKFDFVEDLQQLDINEEDNEEFELALNFGSDRKLRKLRKSIRYAKYFYVENKLFVSLILLILIGYCSVFIYKRLGMYEKTYKENNTLEVSNAYFKVENTYITNQNYKSNVISNNNKYVILNMYSKILYEGANPEFSSRAALVIDDHLFYPTTKYKNSFYDLGVDYSNQELGSEFKKFILIYEIPNQISESTMYLKYLDTNNKSVTIKLSPHEINDSESEFIANMTEKINFKDSTIGNVSLVINSYDLSSKYKLNYNFCIKNTNCIESYEYIYPTLSGAYDKILLKFNANLEFSEDYNLTTNIIEFLKKFGTIKYKIGDNTYTNKVEIKQIKPIKSSIQEYYIEVEESLIHADNIFIEFDIRNKKYIYNLK